MSNRLDTEEQGEMAERFWESVHRNAQNDFFKAVPCSITERFWLFHADNPHVYVELVRLCRLARAKGRKRWSIDGVTEVVRWSRMVTYGEDFKINNNYRPLYARLIMEREPDLEGFFETRTRKAS
jgi:hypothetical protein